MTRARAIATRCCWPPESRSGGGLLRSLSPTSPISSIEPLALRHLAGDPGGENNVLLRRQHRQEVEELKDEADLWRRSGSAPRRLSAVISIPST